MIPSTTAALVGFLFFVAPGLIWELLEERQHPPREGSTFREASRVALASVIFTSISVLLIAGARESFGWYIDPGAWIRQGHVYAEHHYRRIAVTAGTEVLVACVIALGCARPWRLRRTVPQPRIWRVLSTTVPGTERRVSVRLDDGTIYTGAFSGLDHDPRENAYVELQPPLTWSRGGRSRDVEERYQRVLLPLAHVLDVFVEWRTTAPDD